MTRLLILVEGQSEEIFVKKTLKPHLAQKQVFVEPIILWSKRAPSGGGFRGGVSSWKKILESLLPLTYDSNAWVTTMLDFYGLPDDVPGYQAAIGAGDPRKNVVVLEAEILAAIAVVRPAAKFIPFLALHEFEAWMFCAPDAVAAHFELEIAAQLHQAIAECGEPELVNGGNATHPKARLKTIIASYKETSDGPNLLNKIGLPAIRAACPHFANWLNRLETLA